MTLLVARKETTSVLPEEGCRTDTGHGVLLHEHHEDAVTGTTDIWVCQPEKEKLGN
ncbi:MAG TPA: hypothetical protein VIG64_04350 [Actinomycetota bacterium]|jgi:hypothetical protein